MNRQKTLQLTLIAAAVAFAVGCNRTNPDSTTTTTYMTTTTTTLMPTTTTTTLGTTGGAAGTGAGTGSGTSSTPDTGSSSTGTSGTGTSGSGAGTMPSMPTTTRGGAGATDSSNVMGSGSTGAASGKSEGKAAKGDKKGELASPDRNFVTKAATEGLYEVEVARVAAERATNPAVKSFAAMLVDQHSKANDELKQFAASRNVTLPSKLPADKQNTIDRLTKVAGEEFDQQFVQTVGIKDHEKDIKEFEKASKSAKDPELKAWIDKTLPTLRQHLAEAQKLPVAAGKGASGKSSSSATSGTGASSAAGSSGMGSTVGSSGASGAGAGTAGTAGAASTGGTAGTAGAGGSAGTGGAAGGTGGR